jgi:hypothetical protein
VAVLVPRRPVRVGALLSAAGVLATAVLTTPVGLNAGRLSATFALPVLAGYARPDACLVPRPDGWTTLRIGSPGRYTVTGSWRPGPRC